MYSMKLNFLFATIVVNILSGRLFGQSFQPIICDIPTGAGNNPQLYTYSYYGDVQTPKGSLKAIAFFIAYTGNGSVFPSWAQEPTVDDNNLFNATEANIDNQVNLSYFYKQMSINSPDPFLVTGVIYPNLIVVDKLYDQFGNVDYNGIGQEVVAWLNTNDPSYNWGQFDNRTNKPTFTYDNSTSAPDDNIDYAVFTYLDGGTGYGGGAGLYSTNLNLVTNYGGSTHTYHLTHGHTAKTYGNNAELFNDFFEHEFAHNLYDCPHYGNCNGVTGTRFYGEYAWGMMNPSTRAYRCANAWEKWYLGWIDVSASGTPAIINDKPDLTNGGIYILRDFNTTGDAIRLKIPYSTDQYLWLENHEDLTPFDNRSDWQNYDGIGNEICSVLNNGTCIHHSPVGLMMFVENMASSQTVTGLLGSSSKANALKPLAATGNFDYTHSASQQISWEWYGNNIYDYTKGAANPYGAHALGVAGRYDFVSDGIIGVSTDWNSGSGNEMSDIVMENGVCEYGPLQLHESFTTGQKVGLASNPAIHIIQNLTSHKLDPIYIAGLSVEVQSIALNGDLTVKIRYDDFDIAPDVRWCGEFYLSDNTYTAYPNDVSTNVKSNVTLTIDKSGTANTDINTTYPDFIVPTTLTCQNSSFFNVESNGKIVIKNGSTVTLQSGSRMELHNGATLEVDAGSTLIIEDNALLALYDGALVDIKPGGILIDRNSTSGKGIWLDYPNYNAYTAQVKIEGTLSFENGADFIYQGSGYYFFSGTPALLLSTGSDVIWTGAGLGHKMIELNNSVYLSIDGHPVTISNGDLVYHDYSSLNIFNNSIYAHDANFNGIFPSAGTTAIHGENIITKCAIKISGFNNLATAIKLSLITNPPTVLIDQVTFDNCPYAVNASSIDKIIVSNSLAHNVSPTGTTALNFASCNKAYVDNTEVDGYQLAANLGGGTFYMDNSSRFYDCSTGIGGKDAIMFMRNGSLIEKSHVSAIDMEGAYINGAFTSMLTMGDVGCAAIVNNLGAGIIGKNLLLSIDAVLNSQGQGGNPFEHEWFMRSPANPNKLFDICYTHPITSVYARKNIWVQQNLPNTAPPAGSWSFLISANCSNGTYVPLVAPTASISLCVPANTLSCTPCNHQLKEGDIEDSITVASIVSEEFRSDYSPFVENDTVETREAFSDIAALDLNYDSLAATWSITSITGEVFPGDDSTVLRVMVSKILANDSSANEKKDLKDIFAPYYDQLHNPAAHHVHYLSVYPNPASGKLTIEKINHGNIAKISISNLLGVDRYVNLIEEKVSPGTENLPAGVYLVKGFNTEGQLQDVQRVIIQ